MKKILFCMFAISAFMVNTAFNTYAQALEKSSTSSAIINYDLAYPGMLPDHPLYKLKVLRDKITERLINDPVKRINFYLLQTDKQILAASMLVEKNEMALANETALKGENNYTKIVNELRLNKKLLDNNLYKKLKNASLKHQEVLKAVINRMDKNDKITFKNVLYFSKTNLEELDKMQNNKILSE